MNILNIKNEQFENEVLQAEGTVLLDFWAPWCGPCRMLAPILEQVAEERPDVKICKINVDEENALAAQFHISTIPTLVVMEKGKIIAQSAGVKPKADILEML